MRPDATIEVVIDAAELLDQQRLEPIDLAHARLDAMTSARFPRNGRERARIGADRSSQLRDTVHRRR
jgi:hypothetical protein